MLKIKHVYIVLLITFIFCSCLKDNPYIDVSNTQPIIEFSYGSNGSTTLGNFGTNSSVTELDTAIGINIASPQVLDYPVTITLKIDGDYITKFNGQGGTQLELMPDSTYNLDSLTLTIAAGHRIGRIPITIYPSKVDPSTSYGLPIAIVSATGPNGQNLVVSGNAGVAFYAFIGNPIAGTYEEYWSRWNAADTTGGEAAALASGGYYKDDLDPVLFTPSSPTSISVQSEGTGDVDIISFTDVTDPSTFNVSFDQDQFNTLGITLTGGPILERADPVNGYYRVYFTYTNSSGSPRCIVNEYIKQ